MKTSPKCEVQNRLVEVEEKISNILSNKNRNKVNEILQNIANSDISCNTLGIWKQVNQLFPKVLKNAPIGVRDQKGKIVTKPHIVKQIIKQKVSAKTKNKTCKYEYLPFDKDYRRKCKKNN